MLSRRVVAALDENPVGGFFHPAQRLAIQQELDLRHVRRRLDPRRDCDHPPGLDLLGDGERHVHLTGRGYELVLRLPRPLRAGDPDGESVRPVVGREARPEADAVSTPQQPGDLLQYGLDLGRGRELVDLSPRRPGDGGEGVRLPSRLQGDDVDDQPRLHSPVEGLGGGGALRGRAAIGDDDERGAARLVRVGQGRRLNYGSVQGGIAPAGRQAIEGGPHLVRAPVRALHKPGLVLKSDEGYPILPPQGGEKRFDPGADLGQRLVCRVQVEGQDQVNILRIVLVHGDGCRGNETAILGKLKVGCRQSVHRPAVRA